MEDEGGVLGNLPRSRPGRRSQKRTAGAAAAPAGEGSRPRRRTSRPGDSANRAAASAERRGKKAARTRAADAPPPPPEPPSGAAGVSGAVRLAARGTELGVRIATGVTREVLRRLPRP